MSNTLLLEMQRTELKCDIGNFVGVRFYDPKKIQQGDMQKYLKMDRLDDLLERAIKQGWEKLDWKKMHEEKWFCVHDYMIFEELAEYKNEVLAEWETGKWKIQKRVKEIENNEIVEKQANEETNQAFRQTPLYADPYTGQRVIDVSSHFLKSTIKEKKMSNYRLLVSRMIDGVLTTEEKHCNQVKTLLSHIDKICDEAEEQNGYGTFSQYGNCQPIDNREVVMCIWHDGNVLYPMSAGGSWTLWDKCRTARNNAIEEYEREMRAKTEQENNEIVERQTHEEIDALRKQDQIDAEAYDEFFNKLNESNKEIDDEFK